MRKIIHFPWYPFLFSLYPVLSLLAHNVTQVSETAGIRSSLVAIIGAGLLLLVNRLFYRQWHRAAFITAAWALLFFTYGQVYDVVYSRWKITNLAAWMLSIWLILFIGTIILAAFRKIHFETASLTLNIVSIGLVIYPLVLLLEWSFKKTPAVVSAISGPDPVLSVSPAEVLPDIYYIMPEDYGRADLLQQMDQIDDSAFMQYLQDTGFYVAQCSQSNYVTSELSLGSSLNMDYLQNLSPKYTADNIDQGLIWNTIRNNVVSADLKKAGYTTVAFATGFAWSELDNADVYISPALLWSEMTSFETLLLRTTPLRHLEDVGLLNLDQLDGERFRERTLLDFNSVNTLTQMPGPKFVFMQIIAPHPPFVFRGGRLGYKRGFLFEQQRGLQPGQIHPGLPQRGPIYQSDARKNHYNLDREILPASGYHSADRYRSLADLRRGPIQDPQRLLYAGPFRWALSWYFSGEHLSSCTGQLFWSQSVAIG